METMVSKKFNKDILILENVSEEVEKIINRLREEVHGTLKRHGAVVGISGGIDSSVTLALSAKAFGGDKVLGIMLPEKDSSNESKDFALKLAKRFNVQTIEENITQSLEGFGCYRRRDEAVASIFPEYNPTEYKMKIGVNKRGLDQNLPPVFSITIIDKNGVEKSELLPGREYLQIVAASNFKQRSRMSMLYYHAERMHYAMIGTPNKHEVEQGFFVKYGDGGADVMPIAHLYKSQVYQLAEYLGVPAEIINRTPTTDTYTAEQTQEEFFFQMPHKEMDLLWYAFENDIDPAEAGYVMGKTEEEINSIFRNFRRKQKTTEYLRMSPIKF
ncbi:MAG TPA: NAD(+) synthase [Ignavibacteriaceae bacterium]|nr:NAD(+) synthase [Ignavibacteriaceae bacterium]